MNTQVLERTAARKARGSKAVLVAFVAAGLVLTGCRDASPGGSATQTPPVTTPADTSEALDGPAVFAVLPKYFLYASGAGAWGTALIVDETGAFTGEWHDWEAGSSGPDHPAGTRFVCEFTGRFVDVKQVNPYEYSMRVDGFTTTSDPTPTTVEGVLVSPCEPGTQPVGFTSADEFRFYLPGSPVSALPQALVQWERLDDPTQSLTFYALYNVNGSESFRGFFENEY
ncbi:MAG: hypothetical protein FWF02_03530 [Micrococcales bacterium]|nr:hypothetical protein [Micrococcales bacterium]MCL2666760.1 hypothetical protein [Micrococcales bacterium]